MDSKMKLLLISLAAALTLTGCLKDTRSDTVQRQASERLLSEATAQTGMPAIVNFTERKLLKQILEMRDQPKLVTYTYIFAEATGKLNLLCNSFGYGIPAATQYTNPTKIESQSQGIVLPQADPNGLFSPAAAEGTWVLCTQGDKVEPTYIEPRIVVSRFPLQ
jgi:hypothetical protein